MDIHEIKAAIEKETDPSMKKYFENLLGTAESIYAPKDDPRSVVVTELRITHEDKPQNDDVFSLDTDEARKKMKKSPFTIIEGSNYRINVSFRVQHNIVAGLRIINHVTKMGIKVEEETLVLGSYRPQKEPHKVSFPKNGWNEAPHGALARGEYAAKMTFIDDDKKTHLQLEYGFKIEKAKEEKTTKDGGKK